MAPVSLKSRLDTLLKGIKASTKQIERLSIALDIARTILEDMGLSSVEPADDILYRILPLPNAERYDRWFVQHPHYGGERACFLITDDDTPCIEAKFYVLQKKSRSFVTGAVKFTPNWEDKDYTRDSSTSRIGIDFFLTPENSILIILSNREKLRIMELSDHVTNTQVEIFQAWQWALKQDTREKIHYILWEALKLESVNKKFYEGVATSFMDLVQHLSHEGRNTEDAKLFASRLHGRLLFVWFLRKKGIISDRPDYFNIHSLSSTEYYQKCLTLLFFECLNTVVSERRHADRETPYLNGGLFDPKSDKDIEMYDTVTFPEGFFERLYEHFDGFNFTTDESTPEYQQCIIDPEMLGQIFENLLATQIEETGERARKAKGAFYTPREIVSYMCRESLRQYLYGHIQRHESVDRLLDTPVSEWINAGTNSRRDNFTPEEGKALTAALENLTVLDPACGSGAFPIGMLQTMIQCYERLGKRDLYDIKHSIIQKNLYGVDIIPMAVEIARLRAWLSLVIDQEMDRSKPNMGIIPLPNLDFKFKCADSLIPPKEAIRRETIKQLRELQNEYFNSCQNKEAEQRKYLEVCGKESKPFKNEMTPYFDPWELGREDFDIVIGNPPYYQLQKLKNNSTIQQAYKDVGYEVHDSNGDMYCLFYELGFFFWKEQERVFPLVKKETGILAYITSNKWMRAGYGEKLRGYFSRKNPLVLIDLWPWVFESATVDTNILIVQNTANKDTLRALSLTRWDTDDLYSAVKTRWTHLPNPWSGPWYIGSTAELALKAKIESIGKPLKEWDVKIYRGILTGLNEAFIIDTETRDRLVADDPRSAEIIRPILRGRDIQRYGYEWAGLYIIQTGYDTDIPSLYPAVYKHLLQHEEKARKRDDQGKNWWNLRACIYYGEFEKEKVVYGQFQDGSEFSFAPAGYYLSSNEYMISWEYDKKYFLGFLNSRLTKWFLDTSVGSLGGNASIFQKSIFITLPIPLITPANIPTVSAIESLVDRILTTKKDDPDADTGDLDREIDELVYGLYGLTEEEIAIIEEKKN